MHVKRVRTVSECGGTEDRPHGRTDQSMRDECDVNKIVERYKRSGLVNHVNRVQPTYGDFSGAVDLFAAMNMVRAAEARFRTLPARVRAAVDHDPVELLNALADEERTAELMELGLEVEPAAPAGGTPASAEPAEPAPSPAEGEAPQDS